MKSQNKYQSEWMYVSLDDYESNKENIKGCCNAISETLNTYYGKLQTISNESIMSGEVYDTLTEYMYYVEGVKDASATIGEQYSAMVNSFIGQVDSDDEFLYDGKKEKDYSDYAFEMFEEVVRSNSDDRNWFQKLIGGFADFLWETFGVQWDWQDFDAGVYITKDSLNKLSKYELEQLRNLKNKVRETDRAYYGKLNSVYEAFESLRENLGVLNQIMGSYSNFNVKYMDNNLSGLFAELSKKVDTVIDMAQFTDDDVRKFVNQICASGYFMAFVDVSAQFLADIGGKETALMIIFEAFDIAEGTIKHGDYEEYIMKQQLMEMLEDMNENDSLLLSEESEETISEIKKYLGYIEKYGEKWHEHLDGRTKNAKKFKEFLEKIGGIDKVLKYGPDAYEYFAVMFTDYSKSIQIIESLNANYAGDDSMSVCLNEIDALYRKEVDAWLYEAMDKIGDVGVDAAWELLKEATPVAKAIDVIKDSIDTIGKVTGVSKKTENMYKALIYQQMYSSSQRAYMNAVEKFRSMDADSEYYQQALTDVKNCFDFVKRNLIELMEAMAGATDGSKRSYYHYCASAARSASMNDTQAISLFTYEEYMKYLG